VNDSREKVEEWKLEYNEVRPHSVILLTGGEAHDCPVAERLFHRVRPPQRLLGDKAYDSTELREELGERGTKPVIPNRSNRKQQFSFNKRLYKLRWRVENRPP
jgi:IS5 family transposase